jgi:membrane protease YdiL (CAAX protease family)
MDEMQSADPGERRPISFLAAAAWTIGLVMLVSVAVGVTEAARPGAIGDLVNYTACHVLAYSLVLFVMLRVYAPASPMRNALAMRPVSPLHVILSLIVGGALEPALSTAEAMVAKYYPLSAEDVEVTTKLLTAGTPTARVMLVFALVVAVPLTEELFFRGMIFGGLRKGREAGVAMLASAIYFSASQLTPRTLPTAFIFGLVLAWLRAQSGSVISAIAAHVALAAVEIAPLARGADPSADVTYPRSITTGGIAVALVALLLAKLVSTKSARAIEANRQDE